MKLVAALLALVLAAPAARADTYQWPDYLADLQPRAAKSTAKAAMPTLPLTPAAPGTPAGQASYGGLWEGSMCRGWWRDVKVAVAGVTSTGARVEYSQADDRFGASSLVLSAQFGDGVLQGEGRRGFTLTLGMRPDGNMNIKAEVPERWWCANVLKRTKTPPGS